MRFALLLTICSLMWSCQTSAQDQLITKLFRFGEPGSEKPGVVMPNGGMLDVSAFGEDYDEHFFETDGIARLRRWVSENMDKCPKISEVSRFGAPVARPSKILAIGRNYVEHARETGSAVPEEPIIFMKSSTSLCGPNDAMIIPKGSEKTDWEVELAIVIGKKASYVDEASAMGYIAGYSIMNDYSERAWQLEGTGQWTKGKSSDTFGPMGPYLVTPEGIEDPHNLRLWLKVNRETMQDGNTKDMIFNLATIVSYASSVMTLLPGDIIATGTPSGVGRGMNPPRYLKPGEVVELGIEKIGTQKQSVTAYQP